LGVYEDALIPVKHKEPERVPVVLLAYSLVLKR